MTSWPEEGVLVGELALTADDGEAIRTALLAHFERPDARRQIAEPFASQPATWSVGAPWVAAEGPRIDAYYLSPGVSPDELVLRRTLSVQPGGRYALCASLRRQNGRWVVTSFGPEISHARRGP